MRLRVKKDNGYERLYVEKSVRINATKVVTKNVEKLGRVDDLRKSLRGRRNMLMNLTRVKNQ